MKAVIFRRHGGPDVLEYTEVPAPPVNAGEVLVRVEACSVNHLDCWIRQGIPAYQIRLPHISGCDVSGVIEQVGAQVRGVRAGDRVILSPGLSCGSCAYCRAGADNRCVSYGIRGAATDGGYAEYTVARAEEVLSLPPGVSFEEGAAFPLVFVTAWHMLVGRAKLRAGDTALIHAAGSGVGHAAIQIAKHMNAVVYATVGADAKIPHATALGADAVINYQREPVIERVRDLTKGRGVDVVFEHIGPQTWEGSLKALATGGRLVTCGATSGPSISLDLRYVFSRHLSILGSMMGTRAELLTVTRLIGERKLRPVIDTVFPLRDARLAQERMLQRHVFGKFVLTPSSA